MVVDDIVVVRHLYTQESTSVSMICKVDAPLHL
jgi:hypothetical protein